MMKILYDELAFVQTHGGVSRYFAEMIKCLPSDIEWNITVAATRNAYLQQHPFNIPRMKHSLVDFSAHIPSALLRRVFARLYQACGNVLPFGSRFDETRNRNLRESIMEKGNFDVFHLTDPHPRWNSWRKIVGRKPIVATIHDLMPEIFYPHDLLIKMMRRQLITDASHIIAVSEHTKQDIMKFYGVSEKKISVVYHGYLPNAVGSKPVVGLPEKYILYVGKRTYGKNYMLFQKVAIDLLKEDKGLSLFLTGDPLSSEERESFLKAGVADRVVQRFISDDEMRYVFSCAKVFVCPSRYEGFGIPVLDAFAAGCPVVLSDASCLPEVGGNAALYFDVDDGDAMKCQIRKIIGDTGLSKELRARGLMRAKEFSWEKCANETAAVYRRVLTSLV